MTAIDIEIAGREHLSAIPAIELAAATMFSEADLPAALRYKVTQARDLRDAASNERIWVALDPRRKAVGFAMADIIDGNAHLDEIDVLPDYMRRGIGTRLLRTFLSWARMRQFPAATLVTFAHLPWNAPFYAEHGFTIMHKRDFGSELVQLFRQEARAGLNLSNRVCMQLDLERPRERG